MVQLAPANAPLLTGTESLAMVLPEGFISSHHKATSSILLVRAKFQSEFLDSSVDLGVDRLALLHSWVPGLIDIGQIIYVESVFVIPIGYNCHPRWGKGEGHRPRRR